MPNGPNVAKQKVGGEWVGVKGQGPQHSYDVLTLCLGHLLAVYTDGCTSCDCVWPKGNVCMRQHAPSSR